ncbi:hypothetical protein [uncultured Campylobacter sp.]|uniref:hypothetical protein n=1 Tax=uncultured Campylobacter sp. TaxID=218934 RepID=UPI0025E605E1|nr:hypothetical protein [uncultured Campylobacter sp.]
MNIKNELKFYPNVFKSAEFLALKDSLIRLNFSSHFVKMMRHNSFENIIYAKLEFDANRQNPHLGTYGFMLSNQDIKKQLKSTFSSSMASFVINILPDKIKNPKHKK